MKQPIDLISNDINGYQVQALKRLNVESILINAELIRVNVTSKGVYDADLLSVTQKHMFVTRL